MKIKKEIEFELPDIEFKDKDQKEYFEKLFTQILKEDGIIGLLTALERQLELRVLG